jgi:hypothetical protein
MTSRVGAVQSEPAVSLATITVHRDLPTGAGLLTGAVVAAGERVVVENAARPPMDIRRGIAGGQVRVG